MQRPTQEQINSVLERIEWLETDQSLRPPWPDMTYGERYTELRELEWAGFSEKQELEVIGRVMAGEPQELWMQGIERESAAQRDMRNLEAAEAYSEEQFFKSYDATASEAGARHEELMEQRARERSGEIRETEGIARAEAALLSGDPEPGARLQSVDDLEHRQIEIGRWHDAVADEPVDSLPDEPWPGATAGAMALTAEEREIRRDVDGSGLTAAQRDLAYHTLGGGTTKQYRFRQEDEHSSVEMKFEAIDLANARDQVLEECDIYEGDTLSEIGGTDYRFDGKDFKPVEAPTATPEYDPQEYARSSGGKPKDRGPSR